MRSEETKAEMICVAVVAGAHGVRGLVRLKVFTEDPADLLSYGVVQDTEGRRVPLTLKGQVKGAVLAQIPGVCDREQAAQLRGTRFFVPRLALPALDEDDQFYAQDLVGLAVEDLVQTARGAVVAVHNFGAGDLIEFGQGRKTQMVPFTQSFVPEVDLSGGRIVVALSDFEPDIKSDPVPDSVQEGAIERV